MNKIPPRATRHIASDEDDDWIYDTRPPSSTRRYQPAVKQGPQQVDIYYKRQRNTEPIKKLSRIRIDGILIAIGMTMIVALFWWIILGGAWWKVYQDDQHYGRPRTFQIDARVGHNDAQTPSHFVAININRHIIITEFPGGDVTKAIGVVGPTLTGDGQELTPVTLDFQDLNGDGKLDMVVKVDRERFIFINDGTKFRPTKPEDKVNA